MNSEPPTDYRAAGVDIAASDNLIEHIKPLAKATYIPGVIGNLGGFGGLFDLHQAGLLPESKKQEAPILVSGTDGVGTKLLIAIQSDYHEDIGIDLVAMCANDILAQGAKPLFFLDYFATGKLNTTQAQTVITSIAKGCQQAGCALLGGETAEMPDFYDAKHYDLAGFCVGSVYPSALLPKQTQMCEGDILVGLPSSGIHANGFSLVRKLLTQQSVTLNAAAPWDNKHDVAQSLLTPTVIYVSSIMPCLPLLKGLCHITGGGITGNLPRILPSHLGAIIDSTTWPKQPVFDWLKQSANLSWTQMLEIFNCGIGMIAIVSKDNLEALQKIWQSIGQDNYIIGHLCRHNSQYDQIQYEGL